MNDKKKYLALITNFSGLDATLTTHNFLVEKLSKNFEKIFIINDENLKFFPKLAKRNWYRLEGVEESYKAVNKLPENFTLFNPKDSKDFSRFLEDKSLIVINNFSNHLLSIKTHLLVKKHNIKQVQINNLGTLTASNNTSAKHLFKFLYFHFAQTFSKKLVILLSNLNIISKLEFQFLSNKRIIDSIQNSKFKKFLYEKKIFFAKKIILVNSRCYDIYMEKKMPISEDYIIHIDAPLNQKHEAEIRGMLSEEKIDEHYHYLEKFLKKLSRDFNKEVLVCIHPSYDINYHKNHLKDFKVIQFKTREYIYKSFLVTNYDSSVVGDAILLKKKIMGLISPVMGQNEIIHINNYADTVGYIKLNIKEDYLFDKEKILSQMNKNASNYEKYISDFICFEPNKIGVDKIIKTIKEKLF